MKARFDAVTLLCPMLVAAALGFASPASAEQIDLSTSTCKQFLSSSKDDISITLAWLDAYYKDEDAPPVIDTEKLASNAKQLAEYCAANPTIGLITAADKLFDK
jgi:acid stress chaperone HdeB